jgi:osmoprotectant transport system substrate-binding protein
MKKLLVRAVISGILGLSLIASACGSSGGGSPSTTNKGTVTVAGFDFSESSILANIYGGALKGQGWTVNYKLNLGKREVVEPALERGDIDMYPGYAATELEFINKGKGEATADPTATVSKLNTYLSPKNLKALTPAAAVDQNVFVLSKAGVAKAPNAKKLSDLAPFASKMVLGGPPECPTRPFCAKGLETKYGLKFQSFKPLDAGGPLTKAALDRGDIDIGLLFSSDVSVKNYALLEDDKGLQNADNVVPVVRTATVKDDAQKILNDVSAKLTTDDLQTLNKKVDTDKQDPNVVAADWLKSKGFKT